MEEKTSKGYQKPDQATSADYKKKQKRTELHHWLQLMNDFVLLNLQFYKILHCCAVFTFLPNFRWQSRI